MSGLEGVSLKTDCANPDFVLSARWETTVRSGQPVVSSGQQTSRETQRECVTSPTIIFILQQPAAGITTVTILNLPIIGAYTQLERRDL